MSIISLDRKPQKCITCGGRGQWIKTIKTIEQGEEYTSHEVKFCDTCHGKGIIYSDDDIPDYDIGGSSYDADQD